jgi:hypothetical protein
MTRRAVAALHKVAPKRCYRVPKKRLSFGMGCDTDNLIDRHTRLSGGDGRLPAVPAPFSFSFLRKIIDVLAVTCYSEECGGGAPRTLPILSIRRYRNRRATKTRYWRRFPAGPYLAAGMLPGVAARRGAGELRL